MSMLKEYDDLDKARLEDGAKSKKHYKGVNLPGVRTLDKATESVRERIAAMKAERDKDNND